MDWKIGRAPCLLAVAALVALSAWSASATASGGRRRAVATSQEPVITPPAIPEMEVVSDAVMIPETSEPLVVGESGCHGGACEPYYRDRPRGCPSDKRQIILNNRLGEPEWYKYYRCQHYGYHPTQWAAWPEGWLMCRKPMPGPHPYDRTYPKAWWNTRPADREFQPPAASTERQGQAAPKPPARVREEPERLPMQPPRQEPAKQPELKQPPAVAPPDAKKFDTKKAG